MKIRIVILFFFLLVFSTFTWANSDSVFVLNKGYKIKISCTKTPNDSLLISVQNLSKKGIYFALGSGYDPAIHKDTLIVFIGLEGNPLDDIRYYKLDALKPNEKLDTKVFGSNSTNLKLYLTVLLDQKNVKRTFEKEKNLYSYKIENYLYHKLKQKYTYRLNVQ